MSLEDAERESAAVATAARVTFDSIKAKIFQISYLTGFDLSDAVSVAGSTEKDGPVGIPHHLTLCIVVMRNGFVVTGTSCPVSAENFNAELGRKFALENAFRQLWVHEGYLLRERLSTQ